MGALLDVPKTDKISESGQGLDIRYGLSSMQGWRIEMEDAHCAKIGLPFGLDDWSFFAVFDGHAGQRASAYCAYNLLDTILQESYFIDHPRNNQKLSNDDLRNGKTSSTENKQDQKDEQNNDSSMQNCDLEKNNEPEQVDQNKTKCVKGTVNDSLKSGEKEESQTQSTEGDDDQEKQPEQHKPQEEEEKETADEEKKQQQKNQDDANNTERAQLVAQLDKVKEAIRSGFLHLDEKLRCSAGEDKSGTTAVSALISPTHYFFANCGDSRAVLCYKGRVDFATEDHKPVNPKEKDRIVNAGGTVMIQRVNGSLAVSRALGDFDYKRVVGKGPCEQLVSPEPEIHCIRRTEDDEFLILACDGIWDVMTNDEICDFVRYKLRLEDDLEAVCSSVIDVCLYRGSRDNMSIIIVAFEGAPKKCPQAVNIDEKDNNLIKTAVISELYKDPTSSVHDLLVWLNETAVFDMNVPRGAGIESKRDLVHQVLKAFQEEKSNNK